jgi:cyclase
VGGGILTIDDFGRTLDLGADKVSINSGVIKNPGLLDEAARKYGSHTVVFAADVKLVGDKYHVFASGGREDAGLDAIEWFKRGAGEGAGEIVVNSIDTDGVKGGFDIPLLKAVCEVVSIPVVASGGAGSIDDFIKLFKALPEIDAGLAASIFHFGEVKIPQLKRELKNHGILVKMTTDK